MVCEPASCRDPWPVSSGCTVQGGWGRGVPIIDEALRCLQGRCAQVLLNEQPSAWPWGLDSVWVSWCAESRREVCV